MGLIDDLDLLMNLDSTNKRRHKNMALDTDMTKEGLANPIKKLAVGVYISWEQCYIEVQTDRSLIRTPQYIYFDSQEQLRAFAIILQKKLQGDLPD